MSEKITSYVQTDIGKKRTENEDNFVWIENLWGRESLALIGAIDGVGGYEGGAEAALLAKNTIENYLQNFSAGAPLQLLKAAIINANNAIYNKRITDVALQRMSCVLSVAILDSEKQMMYVGHVGDSRGYVCRNNQLLKITSDHSSVGMKEDSGYFSEEEAMTHPRRNEISRMMGDHLLDDADRDEYLEIKEHSFLPGDIALFCSDGLTDLVTKFQMINILSQHGVLKKKTQLLIDEANVLGGKDNITVALATYNVKGKPGRKPSEKNIIEVPIATSAQHTPPGNNTPKKKVFWVLLLIAFLIGFLINWKGTESFFKGNEVPVDTGRVVIDTLLLPDSTMAHDSLINTTDTIFRDSLHP